MFGRIAHVSARAFSGALLETQETDFDSFVLCCDIVTATLYDVLMGKDFTRSYRYVTLLRQ
jgi:hypothetical protein